VHPTLDPAGEGRGRASRPEVGPGLLHLV